MLPGVHVGIHANFLPVWLQDLQSPWRLDVHQDPHNHLLIVVLDGFILFWVYEVFGVHVLLRRVNSNAHIVDIRVFVLGGLVLVLIAVHRQSSNHSHIHYLGVLRHRLTFYTDQILLGSDVVALILQLSEVGDQSLRKSALQVLIEKLLI